MVVLHGKKTAPLEHPWLTIVRIASYPLLGGSPVIRSIAICENGLVSTGIPILYRGTFSRWVRFLCCWHSTHPFTYDCTSRLRVGHQYFPLSLRRVSSRPGCPACAESW